MNHPDNNQLAKELIHQCACELYCKEVRSLTSGNANLQFNAKHAQAHQIHRFRSDSLIEHLSSSSPYLWQLIVRLISADGVNEGALTDNNKAKIMQINIMVFISRLLQAVNKRYNLLGTITGVFLHTCNTPKRVIDVLGRTYASISASAIDSAIKSLSESAVLALKGEGKKFMYSYVLDNFDVQLKHKETTVEQSKDTLFHLTSAALIRLQHATLADLKQSSFLWERSRYNDMRTVPLAEETIFDLYTLHPDNADFYGMIARERFNAWKFMVDICTYGPEYFHPFLNLLSDPETIEKIPVTKTVQIPARSMHNSNASVDGNIKSAAELLSQCGIDDTEDYIIPFHGDLGTYERFRSAQLIRSIEKNPLLRMQYVVFVPGLFHTEMACANTLYKMFLEKKTGHMDETSMYNIIEVLYPNDSAKIANNKGLFQMISNSIIKTGISDRLECWRTYTSSTFTGCDTLDDYAQRCPTLQDMLTVSREMAKTYSSSSLNADAVRRKAFTGRDQQHENILKRIDLILLYEETIYSMRYGDVGRLETCLFTWLPIFRGTGKHKYASMLSEFFLDVHFVFPPPLRKVIRYNWLCNLKGTEDGFRGIDWLLELNNLLTKVIYGGKGSNHTIDRILKESVLIQLYRECKHIMEDQFLISPKTTKHGSPDLKTTFQVLSQMAIAASLLKKKPGRTSGYHVPDVFHIGMEKYDTELNSNEAPTNLELAEVEDPEESNYEVALTEAVDD